MSGELKSCKEPTNTLPTWAECSLRCKNSDFIEKRVVEGGYGAEDDSLLATPLHRFIYEYADANKLKNAWFMHRLELAIQHEVSAANEIKNAELDRLRARERELVEALEDCVVVMSGDCMTKSSLVAALERARSILKGGEQ